MEIGARIAARMMITTHISALSSINALLTLTKTPITAPVSMDNQKDLTSLFSEIS